MSFLGVCPLELVLTRGSGLSGLMGGGGEDLKTSISGILSLEQVSYSCCREEEDSDGGTDLSCGLALLTVLEKGRTTS